LAGVYGILNLAGKTKTAAGWSKWKMETCTCIGSAGNGILRVKNKVVEFGMFFTLAFEDTLCCGKNQGKLRLALLGLDFFPRYA